MKVLLIGIVVSLFSLTANAAWTVASGKVTSVMVYMYHDTILFDLDVLGAPVAACSNNRWFAVSGSMSADRRKQMLSILLSAKATGEAISVAYNEQDGCVAWDNTPNVYRSIKRITY